MKKILLITAGGFLVYMAMTFLIANVLKLTGTNYWVVMAVLLVLGLIAAAVIVWFLSKSEKTQPEGPASADAPGGVGEIDLMFREAEAKLSPHTWGHSAVCRSF